jgi:outer membrane immunogenic protein
MLDRLSGIDKKQVMKSLFYLTIVFCASLALGLTAFGGPEPLPSGKEMKEVAPAPPPECNWSGFYIGLNVGGQFGHSEDKDLDDYNNADQPWGYSESGWVAGGQIGYNFQWKWLVLGIEGDGGYMNLDGRGVQPDTPGGDTSGITNSDFYTTLRGRIGIAFNTWLFYATGGGIGVNYDQRVLDDCAISPCGADLLDAHKTEFDWGYTAGGGIEKMLGCHWSVRAEYLYFAIDRQEFSGVDSAGTTFRFNGDTAGHIVRGGLNYKF